MANRKLKKAYQELNKTLTKKTNIIFGDLGIYLGGQQVVSVPSRSAYVYVRLRSSRSEVVQAFNDKVAQRWDLPVELTYKSGKYVVVGRNENLFSDWVNDEPYLAKHAESHILNREGGQVGGDIVWTYPYQFIPHLVHPFNVPGATNAFIHSHPLYNGDTWVMAGNTGTPSFTPYRPLTSGSSLILVTLNKSTGNPYLFATTGTYIPDTITGSNLLLPYYPTPSSDYIPLSVVRLVSGTSTIGWNNLYDVRQFNSHLPFIQLNSFPEIDNLQFSGLTVSSTGTVAYLSSLGGGGSTGSFGTLKFDIAGTLETGTSMSQPLLITDTSSVSVAYLYAEYLGATGTTIVDVLKNDVSIFTGTPLTLPYNLTGSWVSLTPYYKDFVRGDILKVNVLQKAPSSRNVVVTLSNGIGLGASGLTVEEVDGSPSVSSVTKIQFPTGTISNLGGGVVKYTNNITNPALIWLGKQVATSSASLDFTSLITSQYDIYEFEFINIVPSTNNVRFYMRMSEDNGATFVTGSVYTHSQFRQRAGASANSGAEVGSEAIQIDLMGDTMPNSGNRTFNGSITLFHPLGSTYYKDILGHVRFYNGSQNIQILLQGQYGDTSPVDAVRFLMSSGNIASGEIHLYGRVKS